MVTAHALSPEAPAYKPIRQEMLDNHRRAYVPLGVEASSIPVIIKTESFGINTALKIATSAIGIVDRSQTNIIKRKKDQIC
jgi:hypothetical protein